ncbi:MAG TPA: phage major capsid protein, partial [Ktedonobacteraceae bacterium]|nr:phage major capsid protein [Ktedonobacteraceae bacterium]
MTALQDLAYKNANVAHLFTQVLDEEVGPLRTELKAVEDRLSGEAKQIIARLEAEIRKQDAEMKELKKLMNRPGAVVGFDSPEAKAEASRSAFNKALKKGWGALSADERKFVRHDEDFGIASGDQVGHGQDIEVKALYGVDNTTGGFLTVPEYVNELIEAIVLVSDMHDLVNVRMTANPYVKIPKRVQTASAARIVEQATRNETQNPRFGMVQVFPYESYALTLVSRTDMDDSELDLGTFVMSEFSTQFAKLEGYEIINGQGAGANQCLGFLNDPNITTTQYSGSGGGNGYITSSSSGTFGYPDLVTDVHSLKTGYRKGAAWVFTTETLGAIRKLTDSQNRPLWGPMGSEL